MSRQDHSLTSYDERNLIWEDTLGTTLSPRRTAIIAGSKDVRMYTEYTPTDHTGRTLPKETMFNNMGTPENAIRALASMAAAIATEYGVDLRGLTTEDSE